MVELKRFYNVLIKRHKKACDYLDNNDIPLEQRDKHVSRYQTLMKTINKCVEMLEINEIKMSNNEIRNGFKGADVDGM